MQPAGQDPEARLLPGAVTLPLRSRTNASPFWIMLLLVWGRLDNGRLAERGHLVDGQDLRLLLVEDAQPPNEQPGNNQQGNNQQAKTGDDRSNVPPGSRNLAIGSFGRSFLRRSNTDQEAKVAHGLFNCLGLVPFAMT
jgi:hypothetical protein